MTSSRPSPSSYKPQLPESLSCAQPDHAQLSSNQYPVSPLVHNLQDFNGIDTNVAPNRGDLSRASNRQDPALPPSSPENGPARKPLNQIKHFPRKPSQRPALSCTECARRKIKCDKTVPCSPCTKRGRQDICHQEQWIPSSNINSAEYVQTFDEDILSALNELKQEVSYVHQKVQELDTFRYRLCKLEELVYNIRCDDRQSGKNSSMQTVASSPNRLSEEATSAPCTPSQNLKPLLNPKSREIPSRFYGKNHTPSPATSAIRARMRNGLVDNHENSEDAATTFESLALGLSHQGNESSDPMQSSRSGTFSTAKNCSASLSTTLTTRSHNKEALLTPLPPNALSKLKSSGKSLTKFQSDAIIDFALDTIGWQHPVIHFTTFKVQASTYWRDMQETEKFDPINAKSNVLFVNQAWFALYIALLSVGVHHMSSKHAAVCHLSEDDVNSMPRLWFQDCVAALNRFSFLENPSMETLQAITVLGCSGYDIAPPNILCVLHACANRIAQNMEIHRLSPDPPNYDGQDVESSSSQPKLSATQLMEREICKRVWWALVTQDWFAVPLHKSWSISPGHFSTPIPKNWSDGEFPQMDFSRPPMPDNRISMVMQQIILSQVAAVIQNFFSQLFSKPDELHEDTIFQADDEIQQIVAGLPSSLKEIPDELSTEEMATLPPYVSQLRHFLQISCAHKRLVIHRAFLNHITSVTCCRSRSGKSKVDPKHPNYKKCNKPPFAMNPDITDPDLTGRGKCVPSKLNRKSVIESKAICIQLARQITKQIVKSTSQFHEKPTWSTPYIAVGSITLLSLDLLEMCAIRSSASKLKTKRPSNDSAIESLRPKKYSKRSTDQSADQNYEQRSDPGISINAKAESVSSGEISVYPGMRTDEEIEKETEVRRRELEQGLFVLQHLARWSPIAQRGVILVRNLLNQKDPLKTLIDSERKRIDQEPGYQKPASLEALTDSFSLKAPTTKIVARQDLDGLGVKEASHEPASQISNQNRVTRPANLRKSASLVQEAPSLPHGVHSPGPSTFKQVELDGSFHSANETHYPPYNALYHPLRTQDMRPICQPPSQNTSFCPPQQHAQEETKQREQTTGSNISHPQLDQHSPKYTDRGSQPYTSELRRGSSFTTDPGVLTSIQQTYHDGHRNQTFYSSEASDPNPPALYMGNQPQTFPISHHIPTIMVNGPIADETRSTENGMKVDDKSTQMYEMVDFGVPYDYFESLLHSTFGEYAAPVDFDGLFTPT